MTDFLQRRLIPILTILFFAAFAIAAVLYLFHYLAINPQYDNQGVWHARDLQVAIAKGKFSQFYFAVRKYPMFYVASYALLFELYQYVGNLSHLVVFSIGRAVNFVYAIGILWLLYRLPKRVGGGIEAVILLCSSLLFLLFTSAIRPHIPVAFWTLLAFVCSLALYEEQTPSRRIAAYGSALLAFCTLQSGLFAFIFPVWATFQGRFTLRSAMLAVCCTGVSLLIAIPLGYPFVLGTQEVGADLGHGVGLTYALSHVATLGSQLLGNSAFLILFGIWGCVRLLRSREIRNESYLVIIAYIGIFIAIFGLHTSTMSRFFLPVFPLIALLGARTFENAYPLLRSALLLFCIIACARFAMLTLVPNTYQQASAFVRERPGSFISIAQPPYFFDIPEARRAQASTKPEEIQTVIIPYNDPTQAGGTWELCEDFIASEETNEIVFQWNDTPWAYYRLFEVQRFGPNLAVHCRSGPSEELAQPRVEQKS